MVNISATASDNVGVAKVEFYLNGSLLGSTASTPYTYTWNTAGLSGSQSLSAKAYDAAGNIGASAWIAVTAPPPPDTVKPVVSISSPLNGATVSGSVVISSTASDNVGVTKVEFYLNGSLLGSKASAPYTYTWNTVGLSGSQSLSAKAYDAAGNIGTSAPVSAVIQATTSGTDQWLYQDAMSSSWVDVSWSSVNTFASTGHVYAGSYSLKAVQTSWGGVSLHSGTYVSPINISPGLYSRFEFAVYNTTAGLNLKIYLENDQGQTFTAVTQNNVPVNQWTIISIPMAQLNPSNFNINRINIQNFTALTTTYYLDNVRFVSAGSAPAAQVAPAAQGVQVDEAKVPVVFALHQNYPNPFNPTTTFTYELAQETRVSLKVYNIIGEEVATLVNEVQGAGSRSVMFNASNLASGVYYYRLQTDNFTATKKMMLTK